MGSGRYARGDNALGTCERCGDKVLLKELRLDGYLHDLQVCPECWDPYHPQERLPDVTDPVTLRDPTGDLDETQANITKVAWPMWQPIPAHGSGTPTGGFDTNFNIVESKTPLSVLVTVNAKFSYPLSLEAP